MSLPRWCHHLRAWLLGHLWLPCPVCGLEYDWSNAIEICDSAGPCGLVCSQNCAAYVRMRLDGEPK
jgi:hypothetical protein